MKDLMLRQYYFFPDFNSWSCELGNLTFKVLFESFYMDIILKQNKFTILPLFLNEKSRTVSFAFSVIICVAFGSSSSACCLLNPFAMIL